MLKKILIIGGIIVLLGLAGVGVYVSGSGATAQNNEIELDGLADKSRVDIDAMTESAAGHATDRWEDAALWEMTLFGVSADGELDMTDRLSAASFSYASPAELAEYGEAKTAKPPCMYINVTPHTVTKQTRSGIDDECRPGVVSPTYDARPSCSFDEIWTKVEQQSDIPEDISATVTYRPDEDGGSWTILGDRGFRVDLPDKCEVPGEPTKQSGNENTDQAARPDEDGGEPPSDMSAKDAKLAESVLEDLCPFDKARSDRCATCPVFIVAKPDAGPYVLKSFTRVNITGGEDLLMTFSGCETPKASDKSTVLATRRNGAWRMLTTMKETTGEDCTVAKHKDDRQLVACISKISTRQGTLEALTALEPSEEHTVLSRVLLGVRNNSAECDTERYLLDSIRDVSTADLDEDGDEDLKVMVDRRQGELPDDVETSCDDDFKPKAESERVIFLNDGDAFRQKK